MSQRISAGSRRSQTTTVIRAARNRVATASPMPDAPPITTAGPLVSIASSSRGRKPSATTPQDRWLDSPASRDGRHGSLPGWPVAAPRMKHVRLDRTKGSPARMTLTTRRDDAMLAAGLRQWLSGHDGLDDPVITGLDHPRPGSRVSGVVGVAWWRRVSLSTRPFRPHGPAGGGGHSVTRLRSQLQAQMAADAAGVPVADPVVETDRSRTCTPRSTRAAARRVTMTRSWLCAMHTA